MQPRETPIAKADIFSVSDSPYSDSSPRRRSESNYGDSTPRRLSRASSHLASPKARRQDFEDARDEFRSYRRKYERTAVCGRTFVLVDPLTDQLQNSGLFENLRCKANGVIRSPRHPPTIMIGKLPGYLRIFYILVEIGYPQFFPKFEDYKLDDLQLPLSDTRLSELALPRDKGKLNFYESFLKEQIAWCPISFSTSMSLLQCNRISPFYHQEPIRPHRDNHRLPPSNTSRLFEVHVPSELLHDDICTLLDREGARVPQSPESEAEEGSTSSGNIGKCYRLALKQFPSTNYETFKRERLAFEAMRDQEGLIRCIASYQTSDGEQGEHFNLLLEYAEIDLHAVMTTEAPPVTPDEVESFWDAMLDVCRSLEAIRTIDIEQDKFNVWHCDVKPENILRAGGRFKLADLGEVRIQRFESDGPPQAIITGGTMTYASPEKAAYLDGRVEEPHQIDQNSDVWSLGAVLSIAATYVVLGTQGALKYDRIRRRAIEQAAEKAGVKKSGDGFHDGSKVLEVVTLWHKFLRGATRRNDNFTPAILDLIDNRMLVDSERRCTSKDTANHLDKILKETASEVGSGHDSVPALIQDMLGEIDNDAESLRERSLVSSAASMRTLQPSIRNADVPDESSKSKHDFLKREILPTAPQGGLRRRSSLQPSLPHVFTGSTTRTASRPVPLAVAPPEAGRLKRRTSFEEFYEPYTVFNLREDLDGLDSQPTLSKTARRLSSLWKKRQASVKGKWKANEDLLEKAFHGRDIIFLVDNGPTMEVHWQEATELLCTLARRALGYDEDGIELYFTGQEQKSSVVPPKNQNVQHFLSAMRDARPGGGGKYYAAVKTNIIPRLSSINADYLNRGKLKTIIVLTDGRWEGMANPYAVDELIKSNVRQLKNRQPDSAMGGERSVIKATRPVTIQFVRFGQHPEAMERLRRLDDDLEKEGCEDMVDCEPSNGDVYKMFLGSIHQDMDGKLNIANCPSSPLTPSSSRASFSENGIEEAGDDENSSKAVTN